MDMQEYWKTWEEDDFFSPEGDETLGGRLTRFIIDQVPEFKFPVLFDYTYSEWDDILVYKLLGDVFDYNVTLTPQFIAEIRRFATEDPGRFAKATLNLLDEYVATRAKTAVPA